MSDQNITHAQMVTKLCKSGDIIAAELTGEKAHMLHMAVGISGEAGELLDAVKKVVITNKQIDREHLIEELGDMEFYMEGFRQGIGVTREETLVANVAKLSKRYTGHNYTDSKSIARADKA